LELVAKRGWEVNQQRDKTFTHVRLGAERIGDNIGKQELQARCAKTSKRFGQGLCGTLAIDAARVGLEDLHEFLDDGGERFFAQLGNEETQCLGNYTTSIYVGTMYLWRALLAPCL
jgi:hypothetical protein